MKSEKIKIAQITQERGNTKTLSQVASKSRKWCFTLNNYTKTETALINTTFLSKKWKYIFGKEIGEKKTPHLQGYFEAKNAVSFATVKKIMPRANIRKARGDLKANFKYCSKDGDYTTNIDLTTHREKLKQICLKKYKNVQWKPWQQQILNILKEEPDPRKIHWFYEPTGNTGKSFLCKYIALKYECIICEGKKNDIFNQVNIAIEAEKTPKIILLDIPRTSQEYVNYAALEQLKNGLMYSGKYEGGQCIFPEPHVIAFNNVKPNKEALSEDRWEILKI